MEIKILARRNKTGVTINVFGHLSVQDIRRIVDSTKIRAMRVIESTRRRI